MEVIEFSQIRKDEWDQVVYSSPDGWCFSLSGWLEMVTPIWGMENRSFAIRENGNLVAVVPLHWLPENKHLASGGWGHGGPVILSSLSLADRQRLWQACLAHLDAIAAEVGAERIDVSISPITQTSLTNRWGVNPLVDGGFWDVSTHTRVINLRQPDSELWFTLRKDARQQIKKARNAGYSVQLCSWNEMVDEYYRIHVENYQRTGVLPHPKAYFEGIAEQLDEHYLLWVGISPEGLPVAFHNSACFGEAATYHTGCSETAHLKSGINYLLFWEAILGAQERGCHWYETGEAFPHSNNGKKRGLTDFKGKFGGEMHRLFRGEKTVIFKKKSLPSAISSDIEPKPTFRDVSYNWLRATRELSISIFGRKIVEKLQDLVFCWVAFLRRLRQRARLVYTERVKPPIRFMKPYWNSVERDISLSTIELLPQESLTLFIREFRKVLALPEEVLIIPTGSGRTALELALRALKRKNPTRNKVIIPTYGCRGTFDPIIRSGLTPVFVDITHDLLMDLNMAEELFTQDILACLLVHLCGMKLEMASIIKSAREKGIAIIEDSCQYVGGEVIYPEDSKPDFAIYSFGMGKNIIASAGGALVAYANIAEIQDESRHLQFEEIAFSKYRFEYFAEMYFGSKKIVQVDDSVLNCARTSPYEFVFMNPQDAMILVQQLKKIWDIINRRQRNAQIISISFASYPDLFVTQSSHQHIYTKLCVILKDAQFCAKFRSFLAENGIETEEMYKPLHLREFGKPYQERALPNSESFYSLVTNIPVRPNLTQQELNRIVRSIIEFGTENT
jgi:dTDP-4-amino-4,6-dideoxygalactose transaminase